jgi:hypothetical protein
MFFLHDKSTALLHARSTQRVEITNQREANKLIIEFISTFDWFISLFILFHFFFV